MIGIRRSVTKRANGRWRARYFDPATQRWVAAGTHDTKRSGNDAIDKIIAGMELGVHVPVDKARTAVDTFVNRVFWLTSDVAETSREHYRSLYRNYLEPRWGAVPLDEVTREEVQRWAKIELPSLHMVAKGKTDQTIGASYQRQLYWLFHKIIACAVEEEYIARSPLPRRSGLPRQQSTKPTRVLLPHEVEVLARATSSIREGDGDAIYAAAYGGFRLGELLALRADDLDYRHCEVVVDEQVVVVGGRASIEPSLKRDRSHRSVPMPRLVMEMLAARTMRLDLEGRALLFADTRGNARYPTNWRRRTFDPAVASSGLERLTPHDLRHTAASSWFDEGFDIVEVARMLGDSLAVAEKTYVHLIRGRRPERMRALDERVRRGQQPLANVVPLRQAGIA